MTTNSKGLPDMGTAKATCSTHGEYEAKTINGRTVSMCPACSREQEEAEQRRVEDSRRIENEARISEFIGRAAIPPRFAQKTLEEFIPADSKQESLLDSLKAYAAGFTESRSCGRSLVLYGSTGTGKTHLACGIANTLVRNGFTALYCTAIQAVRSVKNTYSKLSTMTEDEAIRNLTLPDLLILDEVGVQFGTQAESIILFEILNTRYEHMRPTIVISNLDESEITTYLGERVMDRFKEDGGKSILFKWKSYRG